MCGIFCSICHRASEELAIITDTVLPLVKNRGPDSCQCHQIKIHGNNKNDVIVTMYASVLHLRGQTVTRQPLVNASGDALLWNGEVFGGIQVPFEANDTEIILQKLSDLPEGKEDDSIIEVFSSIQGPWAFVFYEASRKKLWYGRDYFGRRSLISSSIENALLLSSVSTRSFKQKCHEIAAKHLYCIDLQTLNLELENTNLEELSTSHIFIPKFIQKKRKANTMHRCQNTLRMVPSERSSPKDYVQSSNRTVENKMDKIPGDDEQSPSTSISDGEGDLTCNLKNSYKSDGIKNIKEVNQANENILSRGKDILNQSSKRTREQENVLGNQVNKMSICDIGYNMSDSALTIEQLQEAFVKVLEESVRARVETIPREISPSDVIADEKEETSLGILFSGGIDSVVLAALAHRFVPENESIDLINVAFEQKYKVPQNVKKKHIKPPTEEEMKKQFDVPDRLTGRSAVGELPKNRKWNFVEVNVTLEELQQERESRITNLVSPLQTVLDDSIGCAIWFAARGMGTKFVYNNERKELELNDEKYTSKVKVLLTGMGADEQLGGYARHRTKFEKSGWVGLHDEMKMELDRISSRNLGRDDRCISDHGREARFPFLDERVIEFLDSIPVCVKCDPRLERGYGEKILLREVALLHLKLPSSSCLPKRAIQFGSRIAKLESGKEKGSQQCERLV